MIQAFGKFIAASFTLFSAAFHLALDLIHSNFDKLLLTALFVYMTFILLHVSHDSMDAADVSWAREQSNLIIGALLGLITGAVLRNGRQSTANPPPEPPMAPESTKEKQP